MLTEADRMVLNVLRGKLLVTKGELVTALSNQNYSGMDLNIRRLVDMGYVEKVESLGTCFVITQKGMRALKE